MERALEFVNLLSGSEPPKKNWYSKLYQNKEFLNANASLAVALKNFFECVSIILVDLVHKIAYEMHICCFSLGRRNNWPVGPVFFLFTYLKQPDEAPWNAWQLLSKFLFKWTQISAWRQSGKPWTSSDQINVVNFVKVSYLEYHIHVNSICVGPGVLEILFKSLFEGIWNLVKLVKFPDSLHGGVVPDITIKLPSQRPSQVIKSETPVGSMCTSLCRSTVAGWWRTHFRIYWRTSGLEI